MSAHITQFEADGKVIQQIINEKLAPSVDGQELGHIVLSLITFTILLMKPDIEVEQLENAVTGTSEYLILQLADRSKLPEA